MVPFDDKQQRGRFVWQEGLLFNAVLERYSVRIGTFEVDGC